MEQGYAQYLLCFAVSAVLLAVVGHPGLAWFSMAIVFLGFHLTNDDRKR